MELPIEPAGDDALGPIEQRRRRGRDKKRRQRAAMTEEQRQAVRASDAESHRRRRARDERGGKGRQAREGCGAHTARLSEEEKAAKRKKKAARRQRAWASLSEEERAAKRQKNRERNQEKRRQLNFIGVDCEGAGKNAGGQQNLALLGAEGKGFASSLHKGIGACGHIESVEAFEWILSLPGKDEAILVGYYFNWDATQILRDIGPRSPKISLTPTTTVPAERGAGRTSIANTPSNTFQGGF
jgi:hypothetical protein